MKFTKMQGIGNDYVYVNCLEETVENPGEVARKVSDRHFGIGSDGLILIKPSLEADFEMDMYNSDGSQGAMCGNGIRCVAKYVYDYGLTDKDEISIATKSGIKYVKLQVENGKVKTVRVDMGAPILNAGLIPIVSENPQVINEAITAGGREYRMTGAYLFALRQNLVRDTLLRAANNIRFGDRRSVLGAIAARPELFGAETYTPRWHPLLKRPLLDRILKGRECRTLLYLRIALRRSSLRLRGRFNA